jgi:hypothetical protein
MLLKIRIMCQYRLYETIYENFDLLIQDSNRLLNPDNAIKLIDITIFLFGKIELKEFNNIEEGLGYNLNKGVNYKFIEYRPESKEVTFLYVAENNTFDKKAYLTWRMGGIGGKWNLYLNSWRHIYAQGEGVGNNSNFDFSLHHLKYAYLSILIYTLTHIEHEDLEEEFERNKRII